MPNDQELYERCWDILVEHAGASKDPEDKAAFVYYMTLQERPAHEYRFCGVLGFGGKLRRNDGRIYVDCYPEDGTPARREIINRVNQLLGEITPKEYVGPE